MFTDAGNLNTIAMLCAKQGWRALILAAAFQVPSVAFADVLQIDPNGGVTVYDKPAIFTADSARPLASPATAAGADVDAAMRAHFQAAGAASDVSPALLEAVAWAESRFRQSARSPAGAIGVMQLMPETAAQLRVDPADAKQNISGGGAYLRAMLDRFGGDVSLALAAYNAGPDAVERRHAASSYAETRSYVAEVMDRLADQALEEPVQ